MTEANPKKRTRFAEPDEDEPGTAPPSTAPSAAAKSFAISNFASLQPATKTLAFHYYDRFLKLKSKGRQQANTHKKLTSVGFIPKSARIKFELGASMKVQETQEYRTLDEHVKNLVATFQQQLTKCIASAAEMEETETASATSTLFCQAMSDLANISMLANTTLTSTAKEARILALTTIEDHPTLMEHVNIANNDFAALYDKHVTNIAGGADHVQDAPILHMERQAVRHQVPEFPEIIKTIFVKSWDAQLKIYNDQDRRLLTETFAKNRLDLAATVTTAAAMDLEETVDAVTMNSLIEKKISEKTKGLQTKVDRLTEELRRSHAVKNNRGANKSSASEKKKKPSSSQKPTTSKRNKSPSKTNQQPKNDDKRKPPPRQKPSADAKNSDSKKGNKNPSRNKSNSKKQRSNRGSNKQSSK